MSPQLKVKSYNVTLTKDKVTMLLQQKGKSCNVIRGHGDRRAECGGTGTPPGWQPSPSGLQRAPTTLGFDP